MFTRICGHNIRQLVHLQGKAGFLKGFLHPGKPKPSIEDSTLADFNPKPHRNQTTPVHWWQQQPNITQPRDAAPAAFEEPQIATLLGRSAIRMLSRQSFEFATHGGWIKPWQSGPWWPGCKCSQILGKSWEMSPVLVKAVGQTPRKKSLLSYPWISASQTSPSTAMLSSSNFSRSERKSCKKAAASSLEQVIFSWGSARKSETQQVLQTPWGWVHSTSQR